MDSFNVYSDIAERTKGDLYVGVVGPVRTGKSTFISKFVEKFVLPNIDDSLEYNCTMDELPQSADGVEIMTTQPKFVPAQAVRVDLGGNVYANVRMIDCVGYFVDGAKGKTDENGNMRMVKTPWSDKEMPIEEAAEIGTRRVIDEHSSVAVLLTSDGSFGGIGRKDFETAENRLNGELKQSGKPYVIVLNSTKPKDKDTLKLVNELQKKYNVGVLAVDVAKLSEENVSEIFDKMLLEFPINSVEVNLPKWLTALPFDHPIIAELTTEMKSACAGLHKIGEFPKDRVMFGDSAYFEPFRMNGVEMGEGRITFDLNTKENLFYQVLSNQCGLEINNDFELISQIKSLAEAKREWEKVASALEQVKQDGYGVVEPSIDELELEEPHISKLGGNRYSVKIKAKAPSLHIMRVDIETEINPLVGTEQQSNDLVAYLKEQADTKENGMWDANMFGKTMHDLVSEGMSGKINSMPFEAQKKMRRVLTRIVNEGRGGLICILL